jgi:hypothetical protein
VYQGKRHRRQQHAQQRELRSRKRLQHVTPKQSLFSQRGEEQQNSRTHERSDYGCGQPGAAKRKRQTSSRGRNHNCKRQRRKTNRGSNE